MDEKVNFNFSENFFAMKELSLIISNIVEDIEKYAIKYAKNCCDFFFVQKLHTHICIVSNIILYLLEERVTLNVQISRRGKFAI